MTDKIKKMDKKQKVTFAWENLQLLVLAGTIFGQCTVGASFLLGQGVWAACNTIALIRDFVLRRPAADKIKNAALLGITVGLIVAYLLGFYGVK